MPNQILIFGEVLADVFPEQTIIGGAPYNVARHLRAFGLAPSMLTRVGEDAYGAQILQEMAGNDLNISGVQRDKDFPTGQVKVTFIPQGHQFEILNNQAYDFFDEKLALGVLNTLTPNMLYIGTLALRNLQTRTVAKKIVEKLDCPIFCDINLRAPWYSTEVIDWVLNVADTVKINHEELAEIVTMLGITATEPKAQVEALQQKYQLANVLLTFGDAGSWWLTRSGEIHRIGPAPLENAFVDSVGAGDAYSAVAILGMLREWKLEIILQRASQFAAAICTVRGVVPPEKKFYTPFLESWL